MKKLILVALVLTVAACAKDEIINTYAYFTKNSIFENEGGVLKDATSIEFNLDVEGEYVLSLKDEFTSKVVTKELFIGKEGVNTLNVFTKVVPKGSYHLILKDKNGNEVQQTKISI